MTCSLPKTATKLALEVVGQPDGPKLVIFDWLMPGLNGIELCQHVRSMPQEPYTYILLLTSKRDKKDVVEGLSAGADDYITKPFDPQELKVRLRRGQAHHLPARPAHRGPRIAPSPGDARLANAALESDRHPRDARQRGGPRQTGVRLAGRRVSRLGSFQERQRYVWPPRGRCDSLRDRKCAVPSDSPLRFHRPHRRRGVHGGFARLQPAQFRQPRRAVALGHLAGESRDGRRAGAGRG